MASEEILTFFNLALVTGLRLRIMRAPADEGRRGSSKVAVRRLWKSSLKTRSSNRSGRLVWGCRKIALDPSNTVNSFGAGVYPGTWLEIKLFRLGHESGEADWLCRAV